MKKDRKKLILNRETLRNLQEAQLREIVGGTTGTRQLSCDTITWRTCPSEHICCTNLDTTC